MKSSFASTWWHRVVLLAGLVTGSYAAASAQQVIIGTIQQATSPANGVDVYYKSTQNPGTTLATGLRFTTINVCVSIPTVSPIPTAIITSTAATGNIGMVPNSVAQGGNPVAYNGRLYYIWVSAAPPLTSASFTAGTEFKAFNITFSGGTSTQQVQLNDNQVSTSALGQLGQAAFYVEMSGIGQVSPDPTNSGNHYAGVNGTPFYADAGKSTHGTASHPASASNPTVSPGGIDYQAQTIQAVPLPVQLTAFTAAKQAADGLLSWATASEVNSDYFEVQASADGSAWQALGRVAAAGTSTTPRAYRYLDKTLARYGVPLVYYRLRQADLDGTSTFSSVRTLAPDAVAAWQVGAYPNPFQTSLAAQLTTAEAGPVTLTLYDATGRVVLRQQATTTAGTQLLDLRAAASIATGTYLLRVQQGSHAGAAHLTKE